MQDALSVRKLDAIDYGTMPIKDYPRVSSSKEEAVRRVPYDPITGLGSVSIRIAHRPGSKTARESHLFNTEAVIPVGEGASLRFKRGHFTTTFSIDSDVTSQEFSDLALTHHGFLLEGVNGTVIEDFATSTLAQLRNGEF